MLIYLREHRVCACVPSAHRCPVHTVCMSICHRREINSVATNFTTVYMNRLKSILNHARSQSDPSSLIYEYEIAVHLEEDTSRVWARSGTSLSTKLFVSRTYSYECHIQYKHRSARGQGYTAAADVRTLSVCSSTRRVHRVVHTRRTHRRNVHVHTL